MTDQGIATCVDGGTRALVVPRIHRLDVLLVTSGLGASLRRHWLCFSEHARHSSEPMAASRHYLAAGAFDADPSRKALELHVWERAATSALSSSMSTVDLPGYIRGSLGHAALGTAFCSAAFVWSSLPPSMRRIVEGADCLLAISQTTVNEARRYNPWLAPSGRRAFGG